MRAPRQRKIQKQVHTDDPSLVCPYCHKHFVGDRRFLKHNCKQKKKLEELKTPRGQAAFNYYQHWMKLQKRVVPKANTFCDSRYYRTFINFVDFSIKTHMPNPEQFIWLMNQKKFPPTMWTIDEAYSAYVEFIDTKAEPMDMVTISLKTLLKYSDHKNIDIGDVFNTMTPTELIYLIRVRQLSPWLLLFSKTFASLLTSLSDEQLSIVETFIKPATWAERKQQYVSEIDKIKQYVAEIGI